MKPNLEESPPGRSTSICCFGFWFGFGFFGLFFFSSPWGGRPSLTETRGSNRSEHWVGNSPQLKVLILFVMSSREAHVATAAILTDILSFVIALICLGFFPHKPGYPGPTFPGKWWAYARVVANTYRTSWYIDVPPSLADIYSFGVNEIKCWQFHTKKRACYEIWIGIHLCVRK